MRKFIKGVSAGNDYIYVYGKPCDKEKIVRACDRRNGIGGDGVVFYEKTDGGCYSFEIFNADGSEAEFCGNASLTLAKILLCGSVAEQLNAAPECIKERVKKLKFITRAGVRDVETIGEKAFLAAPLPVKINVEFARALCAKTIAGAKVLSAGVFSAGNLHLAVRAEKATRETAEEISAAAEKCGEFPLGVNVEVFSLTERGAQAVVKERGSGFTGSCGSGALCIYSLFEECASAKNGLKILFEGGELTVLKRDEKLLLCGCPKVVFKGKSEWLL